jgi:FtsP/CotA-like multicopper oxidase with cupredoxin domain
MNETSIITKNDGDATTPSRRRFVASALAAALGVSLADVIGPEELGAAPQAAAQPVTNYCSTQFKAFVPVGELVRDPKTGPDGKPGLNIDMTVKWAVKSAATIAGEEYKCQPMTLRYFEGHYHGNPSGSKWPTNPALPGPGPTLRVRVGDRVQVHLSNEIDPTKFPQTQTDPNNKICDIQNATDPDTGGNIALYPQKEFMPSCLHGDNITNMHYHGTHVTPDGTGDNVMVDVYPKGHEPKTPPPTPPQTVWSQYTNDFMMPLPPPAANPLEPSKKMTMGQAPGTHWYHAHKHGSVALQLLNGMSGALIIEGEFDDQLEALMPGLRKTEKVMVIQQLGDKVSIQKTQGSVQPGVPLNTCAAGDPTPLVNGQLQPTIEMKPGEIQRWRFVNATMQQVSYLTYRLIGPDVYNAWSKAGALPIDPNAPVIRQIAYDGVQLAPERYNDPNFGLAQEFTMAPGNRTDILVQAPLTEGVFLLAFQSVHGAPPAGCQPTTVIDRFLLRLKVTAGSTVNMTFPTAANFPPMPEWLKWDDDPKITLPTRTLIFNWASGDKTNRPAIDGKVFDESPNSTTVQRFTLNTAEEMILENYWASSIHPFHIHVNPFQVLEIFDPNNPGPTQHIIMEKPYIWRDTIAIPAANDHGKGADGQDPQGNRPPTTNGWVKIRSRFVDFPGTFVLHCHILDHEDRGMMQEVQVQDPTKPAPALVIHHH